MAKQAPTTRLKSNSVWAKFILVDGKYHLAIRGLRLIASKLPAMLHADGSKVDHLEELKALYERGGEKEGLKAVNLYIAHIQKTCERNYFNFRLRRFRDRCLAFIGFKKPRMNVKIDTNGTTMSDWEKDKDGNNKSKY